MAIIRVNFKEIEKDEFIKKEIARLKRIFKDIEPNAKNTATGLIEEAAYMKATLCELKEIIDKEGAVDEMPQGSYSIMREHPALKSYNAMVQRYANVIKQLISLLPKNELKEEDDGFEDFINSK